MENLLFSYKVHVMLVPLSIHEMLKHAYNVQVSRTKKLPTEQAIALFEENYERHYGRKSLSIFQCN